MRKQSKYHLRIIILMKLQVREKPIQKRYYFLLFPYFLVEYQTNNMVQGVEKYGWSGDNELFILCKRYLK